MTIIMKMTFFDYYEEKTNCAVKKDTDFFCVQDLSVFSRKNGCVMKYRNAIHLEKKQSQIPQKMFHAQKYPQLILLRYLVVEEKIKIQKF